MGNTGDVVCPYFLLFQGMVRVTLGQKVLKEPHILKTEEGNLVMRLSLN